MRVYTEKKLQAGQMLGHYQLIRPLDQGRAIEIWAGLHFDLQMPVVLKVLLRNRGEEEYLHYGQRLREEARVLAGLHHPHIVGYRDYLPERNFLALVMEYAPGGSIARRYPTGRKLSLSLVRLYTWQMAHALFTLHKSGLIHRDVKPGNILLLGSHYALLGDFGLALFASAGYTRRLYRGGTSAYMAPEQFQGYPCAASDQYSLAICVYEWLTGHRPFSGENTQTLRRRQHLPLVTVRSCRPELPEAVNLILRTALHPEPEKRYQSVLDFAQAFVEITRTVRPPLVRRLPYDRGARLLDGPDSKDKESCPSTMPRLRKVVVSRPLSDMPALPCL